MSQSSDASTTDHHRPSRLTLGAALRAACRFDLRGPVVEICLRRHEDSGELLESDVLFARAYRDGLDSLPVNQRRGKLATVTGLVAEAVAGIVLDEIGCSAFYDVTEHGRHGVDLLAITPQVSVIAFEVKGTLRAGAFPRMTPSARRQLSRAWLNGPENKGMLEWTLEADDLYAGVVVVDFGAGTWRSALSHDFESFSPVASPLELASPASLFS